MNTKHCPKCRTELTAQARFCHQCGAPQDPLAAGPQLAPGNRWARQPGEFAVRFEAADLRAILERGVAVEEGTTGLLFQQGRMVGSLTPGYHTVQTLLGRLKNVLFDTPSSVLLVDVGETLLDVSCGALRTSDDQEVSARLRLVMALQNPLDFFVNLMKGAGRVTSQDLGDRVREPIQSVLQPLVQQCTAAELYGNQDLQERIELDVRSLLADRFARLGLAFDRVEFVAFSGESDDEIRRRRGQLHRDVALAEIDAARRQLVARLDTEATRERMQKLKSEAEFGQFVQRLEHEIFRRDLLRKQERDELWRQYRERAEDHEAARRHLVALADWQRRVELATAEHGQQLDAIRQQHERELQALRNRSDLDNLQRAERERGLDEDLQGRLRRERQQFDARLDREQIEFRTGLEREGLTFDEGLRQRVAATRTEQTLDAEQRAQTLADARAAVELYDQYRGVKQKHAQADRRFDHDLEADRAEAEHRRKLAELTKLNELSGDALLAAAPAEQAALLADLRKTDTLKGMSPEQILALYAQGSPEIAKALTEKFRATGDAAAQAKAEQLYERMLTEKDAALQTVQASHQQSLQMLQQLAEKALATQRDTAVAAAGGHAMPAVVGIPTGGPALGGWAGPQVVVTPGATTACPRCGQPVRPQGRFCPHCGQPL